MCGTPGGSYIAGLHHLITGNSGTAVDIIAVIVFNLIMFSLVIIPFAFLELRPEGTKRALRDVSDWLTRHARQVIASVALGVGAYLWFFAPQEVVEHPMALAPTIGPDLTGIVAVGHF